MAGMNKDELRIQLVIAIMSGEPTRLIPPDQQETKRDFAESVVRYADALVEAIAKRESE